MSRYCSWRVPPLPQHVQEILNHLVGGRDNSGIGRVGLLGDDQLRELVGDIGIGPLKGGPYDLARRSVNGGTRPVRHLEGATVDAFEIIGTIECSERDVRELERSPIRVAANDRSEEHTSELQSLRHLVCRLLLEKK